MAVAHVVRQAWTRLVLHGTVCVHMCVNVFVSHGYIC